MKSTLRWLFLTVLLLQFVNSASAIYDPRLGRFLSRDPLREEGGINLYAYCGNDPVNRHDPLGLDWNPFHETFWTEGTDANWNRAASAMLHLTAFVAGRSASPPALLEAIQNSPTQNVRNIGGGIQVGTGNALLAGPSAFFSLQGGVGTFLNRAIGSSLGISDQVLESTDLRDPSTIALQGGLNSLQQGNIALAQSLEADPSSLLFQGSSQAATLAALTLAPELCELKLPQVSLFNRRGIDPIWEILSPEGSAFEARPLTLSRRSPKLLPNSSTALTLGTRLRIRIRASDFTPQMIDVIKARYNIANFRLASRREIAIVGNQVPYSSYLSRKYVRDVLYPDLPVSEVRIPIGFNVDEFVSRQFGGRQLRENQSLLIERINKALGPLEESAATILPDGTVLQGFDLEFY